MRFLYQFAAHCHCIDIFASTYRLHMDALQDFIAAFARHILSNVGRVAARDSSRTVATVRDLFVALCEDASVYSAFKTMKGACRGYYALLIANVTECVCSVRPD